MTDASPETMWHMLIRYNYISVVSLFRAVSRLLVQVHGARLRAVREALRGQLSRAIWPIDS